MRPFFALLLLFLLFGASCVRHEESLPLIRARQAQYEQFFLSGRADLVTHPLTLEEIIRIALENNLDLYVQTYEIAASCEQSKSEALKMLPDLTLTNRATNRTQNTASFSQSLIPGVPPAPLSIGRDRYIEAANLNLAWRMVDFGIAYYRSRQAANNVCVRYMEYERIRDKLILDLTTNYWRAVSGKKAVDDMDELLARTLKERKKIRMQIEKKLTSDIPGLTAEDKLAEAEVDMLRFKRTYHESISELKKLMGVPPYVNLEIVVPENLFDEIETAPIEELERVALLNRNELYDKDLKVLITRDGMRESFVQLFPGLELFIGPYYDSNSFYLHNNWVEAGCALAWNLLQLPARVKQHKMLSKQKDKACAERLQMALAVLTQVRLSHIMVEDYAEAFRAAKNFYKARDELFRAVQKRVRTGESYEGYALAFEARAYIAQLNMLAAYANFRTAIETLNNAIGLPLYYGTEEGSLYPCSDCCP